MLLSKLLTQFWQHKPSMHSKSWGEHEANWNDLWLKVQTIQKHFPRNNAFLLSLVHASIGWVSLGHEQRPSIWEIPPYPYHAPCAWIESWIMLAVKKLQSQIFLTRAYSLVTIKFGIDTFLWVFLSFDLFPSAMRTLGLDAQTRNARINLLVFAVWAEL